MIERKTSYADMYVRHSKLQDRSKLFTSKSVAELLDLEQIHQARTYINWMLSCDKARYIRDDGNEVFYSFPPPLELLRKPWHPSSILPKGYWNGSSSRGHWFNHLWIEEASA